MHVFSSGPKFCVNKCVAGWFVQQNFYYWSTYVRIHRKNFRPLAVFKVTRCQDIACVVRRGSFSLIITSSFSPYMQQHFSTKIQPKAYRILYSNIASQAFYFCNPSCTYVQNACIQCTQHERRRWGRRAQRGTYVRTMTVMVIVRAALVASYARVLYCGGFKCLFLHFALTINTFCCIFPACFPEAYVVHSHT